MNKFTDSTRYDIQGFFARKQYTAEMEVTEHVNGTWTTILKITN